MGTLKLHVSSKLIVSDVYGEIFPFLMQHPYTSPTISREDVGGWVALQDAAISATGARDEGVQSSRRVRRFAYPTGVKSSSSLPVLFGIVMARSSPSSD